MNITQLIKAARSFMKRSAHGFVAAAILGAGTAQAATTNAVINLGSPGNGTYFAPYALVPKISQGTLPVGSILRSVIMNYTLEGGEPYLGDLAPLFADSTGDNGVLLIAGNPNDGGYPKGAATTVSWNSGDNYSIGATASATLTAADGIPPIDLNSYTVWFEIQGYAGTLSGSVTLVYDIPEPARITTFGPGAVITGTNIVWTVPYGTTELQVAALAPVYTLSSGLCDQTNGAIPTPALSTSSPVTYIVTDGAIQNVYAVKVAVADPHDTLNVHTYSGIDSQALLSPISNLMGVTPTTSGVQTVAINYGNFSTLPGPPPADHFSVLWEGWFDVTLDGTGIYTFGTASDDGSVIYLDLNEDGDFADAGELIVNNNYYQGKSEVVGTVELNMSSVHMVIGFYQGGGGKDMEARFKKGSGLGFGTLNFINSSTGYFFTSNPYAAPQAKILTFGPGAVINQTTTNIAWAVPYGTAVTNLAPTYTLSDGAVCDKASGSTNDFTSPVHYIVRSSDNLRTNDYTVTVTVLPDFPVLINVNYYGGSKPGNADMDGISSHDATASGTGTRVAPSTYLGSAWNDFNSATASGSNLKNSLGGATSVGLVTTMQAGPWNDWNGFGARMNVSGVVANYNEYKPIFTLTGLTPSHAYDLYIASLLNSDNHPTDFKVWSTVQHLENNPSGSTDWTEGKNFVHFVNVIPDASGTLVVYAKGSGSWNGVVLNGFQLQDMGARGLNSDAALYAFSFPGAAPVTWVGTTISVPLASGTAVSALTPAFTMSPGATCTANGSPVVSGSPVNFSSPVHFIVKSEDEATTTDYTVTVNFVAPTGKINLNFDVALRTGLVGPAGGLTEVWNQPLALSGSALLDSAGVVTTVSFVNSCDGIDPWSGTLAMLISGARSFGWDTQRSLVLSGLNPVKRYNLFIASFYNNENGSKGVFSTANVTSNGQIQNNDNGGPGGNSSTWVQGVNYVVFKDVKPDAENKITILADGVSGCRAMWSGFQLVELPPSGTVLSIK